MTQLVDKLDIPPEVQKKIACANDVNVVSETYVSDLEYVSINNRHYLIFKRMMDIMIALAALVIIAVPMMIVFCIMYIDDPGNVMFAQYRVGLGGAALSSISCALCGKIPPNICRQVKWITRAAT